jgi:hypothetical protein
MRWRRGQRLMLVSENEAPGPTREIFRQVRENLGIPAVPKLYQAYAAFPEFLQLHWRAFGPALELRESFLLGSRLAAESYTRAHNYFEIASLWHETGNAHGPSCLSWMQVLDYYLYLDPLLLLIAAAQMRAFEGPVGTPLTCAEPAQHSRFAVAPSLLKNDQAGPELERSWMERRRMLELAFVADEHRALACWPEAYTEYWATLKRLLQSPVYADCRYRLAGSALSMADEFPVAVETNLAQLQSAGLDDDQISSLVRINEAFLQDLTGLVLDITFARIGWEGGTRTGPCAHQSPAPEPPHTAGSPIRVA